MFIQMEQDMKEIGWMIYNMDLELNHGLIKQNLKDNINMEKKKGMVNMYGMINLFMSEIGVIIN